MPKLSITLNEQSQQPLELTFNGESSLSWDTVVGAVVNANASVDLPLVLYHKIDTSVKSIESESQLQALLIHDNVHLFTTAQLVNDKSIVTIEQPAPIPPISAFNRLGQLIESNKRIISSSRHLSRGVGILASAIALDKNNKDFDNEFKALEKVIESRKDSNNVDEEELLMFAFRDHARGRGKPGFGRGFGGHHHHHQHADRGGFGLRGRGHPHLHHHGPPIDFSGMMAMDEKLHKNQKKAQACFRGGRRGSCSSGDEVVDALRSRMKNTHIHLSKDKKKHQK